MNSPPSLHTIRPVKTSLCVSLGVLLLFLTGCASPPNWNLLGKQTVYNVSEGLTPAYKAQTAGGNVSGENAPEGARFTIPLAELVGGMNPAELSELRDLLDNLPDPSKAGSDADEQADPDKEPGTGTGGEGDLEEDEDRGNVGEPKEAPLWKPKSHNDNLGVFLFPASFAGKISKVTARAGGRDFVLDDNGLSNGFRPTYRATKPIPGGIGKVVAHLNTLERIEYHMLDMSKRHDGKESFAAVEHKLEE